MSWCLGIGRLQKEKVKSTHIKYQVLLLQIREGHGAIQRENWKTIELDPFNTGTHFHNCSAYHLSILKSFRNACRNWNSTDSGHSFSDLHKLSLITPKTRGENVSQYWRGKVWQRSNWYSDTTHSLLINLLLSFNLKYYDFFITH